MLFLMKILSIKRVNNYLEDTFCLTDWDGVAYIDLNKLIKFHKSHKRIATLTSVKPPDRWSSLNIKDKIVKGF